MRRRAFLGQVTGLAVFGLATACSSPAPPPAAAPPGAGAAAGATQGQGQASAGAGASSSPSPSSDWDALVAAAKQEGQLALAGPIGEDRQAVLTKGFQDQYGITVNYLADQGAGLPPRIGTERAAGQFLWDVLITGTTTSLQGLVPLGALDPIDPALVLPDVTDPATWRGGALPVIGPNREVLVMTPMQMGTLFYNTQLLTGTEITSYRDLLAPTWKGKMALDDPRRGGPGQGTLTFFYLHPDLGPDFIRQLAQQDFTVMSSYPQEMDAVGQGEFPLLVGGGDADAEIRIREGIPLNIVDRRVIQEGTHVGCASGCISVFNRPAHPNAARLYVNWLLSRDPLYAFAQTIGFVAARLDVPTDYVEPWRIPVPGSINTYDAAALAAKDAVLPLLQQVFI